MRFFLFIVALAAVLGSVTVVYLNVLEAKRPPEPVAPSRADTLKPLIDRGDPDALVAMAELYRSGAGGVPKDLKAARRLFEAAARKGHPPAQVAMGRLYMRGEGVREDATKAAQWYGTAARFAGSPEAQYELGRLYDLGRGVDHNPAKARELYVQAGSGGHAVAQYLAGISHEQGWDGLPDLVEAYRWYLLAAEKPDVVRAANSGYDAPGAVARLAADMNRWQKEEAARRAAKTRAGYRRSL